MKAAINGCLETIAHPIGGITVPEEYRHLFGMPESDLVIHAAQRYREDPTFDGGIHVTGDEFLLAGEAYLVAARRAGLPQVRVTLHRDIAGWPTARKARMIVLALQRPDSPMMVKIRCLELACQLLREAACPAFPGLPQTTNCIDMITSYLGCSPADARCYLRVLRALRPVQDAFDRGEIDLTEATQAYRKPQAEQRELGGWFRFRHLAGQSVHEMELFILYMEARRAFLGLGICPSPRS